MRWVRFFIFADARCPLSGFVRFCKPQMDADERRSCEYFHPRSSASICGSILLARADRPRVLSISPRARRICAPERATIVAGESEMRNFRAQRAARLGAKTRNCKV